MQMTVYFTEYRLPYRHSRAELVLFPLLHVNRCNLRIIKIKNRFQRIFAKPNIYQSRSPQIKYKFLVEILINRKL